MRPRALRVLRPPSTRTLGLLQVALVLLVGGALVWVTVLARHTAAERTDAEAGRVRSFAVADQMRQSSNDLTRMVRIYVGTGDDRYRRYYEEILAIRRGQAPRPVDYDSSYWDRVLADGEARVRFGPPTALVELMRRAGFAEDEFIALAESLRISDRLAARERSLMAQAARRRAAGRSTADLSREVSDEAYHREKGRIMGSITRFSALVDARTARRSAALSDRTARLLVDQFGLLALLGLALVAFGMLTARLVAVPLERLAAVTRRIAKGETSARAPAGGVQELHRLAGDFNRMAEAVEEELTGRRVAERDARESGDRLQRIADRVPGAVFHFHVDRDDALSVRFASRDGSVHGVAAEQGVDFASVSQAVLAEDRGAWLDGMVAAARKGGAWHHEYRVRTAFGGTAWMEARMLARPALDGSGDLYGYVDDVTERKALEEQLRRARERAEAADKAKSAFLAMVSHELRTPLVAVSGTLEVLALRDLDAEQHDLVEVARGSTRALLALVGDVLDLSKIEAGALELAPVPTDLAALVDGLVAQHGAIAAAKGLTVSAEVDPRLAPGVLVDALRLNQVLGNLVANAVKFTDRGGVEVRVEVRADLGTAQGLLVTVRDTGIGIAPEDRARLFAPFTQVSSPGRREGGTGLGLVICRQLVQAMGGTVALVSTPGAGTTVRVELELAVCAPPDADGDVVAVRPRPTRAGALAEGSLLLLVEDHPVSRRIVRLQLEALGFVCDTAEDAAEALERFGAERYGLVLCDLRLPDQDGFALAGRLRALEAARGLPRTPVVALTASALQGERERCHAAGMDDLLAKPASMAAMQQTLRRWLPLLSWPATAPASPAGPPPGSPRAFRPDADGPVLDQAVLEEFTDGDDRLRDELITDYLRTLRDDLEALADDVAAGDLDAVRRRAHAVAGASWLVGAKQVARDANRVESDPADADVAQRLLAHRPARRPAEPV